MSQEVKAAMVEALGESKAAVGQPASVVTRMVFKALPAEVWRGLLFYEEIGERPPIHLRLLLPVPTRIEGQVGEVGDEAICVYESGHLVKRISRIEWESLYAFEITEQALSIGAGMRLSGGQYTLRALADERTEVAVETRYISSRWPRGFWAPLECLVCHWFHRYLLRTMRRKVESR